MGMLHTTSDIIWLRKDLAQRQWTSTLHAFIAGWMEHQREQTHTATPHPFREGAWGGEVSMLQLVSAAPSSVEMRRLVARLRQNIRRELVRLGLSMHFNFTL